MRILVWITGLSRFPGEDRTWGHRRFSLNQTNSIRSFLDFVAYFFKYLSYFGLLFPYKDTLKNINMLKLSKMKLIDIVIQTSINEECLILK